MHYANYFVDIGTMEGYYAIVAKKINANCKIIGIEPTSGAEEKFFNNFKLNNIYLDSNIQFIEKYLGLKDDKNTITLNSLLNDKEGPFFILIDIEGQG